MSDEPTPVPVEIVEPVEVRPNGSKIARSGRRWVTIGYVLLALGTFLGLAFSWQAAQTAKRTAAKLQNEVTQRCVISEQSRRVLREEHEQKLRRALAARERVRAFETGERPIPAGFTQKDIDIAVADAEQDIKDERAVLDDVKPVPCK